MPETSRPDVRLDLIPAEPGVYLMKDSTGSVIYVGKAKQLRNRLSSYFSGTPDGNAKVAALIEKIASFNYIVTGNELEAFLLEATLIKEYKPHYNVMLRDDREYPFIRVTLQEQYPRIMKAFHIGPDSADGARYYGPYLSGDLYRALKALYDIFPLKTCKRVFPRDIGKERPCLNFYIGRCIGPCRGDVSAEAYRAVVENVCRFLEGRYMPLLAAIRQKMQQASSNLEFEQAGYWRDRYRALNVLMEKQHVASDDKSDRDVIALAENEQEICLLKVEVREGRVNAFMPFFFELEDKAEVLESFLTQHYTDAPYVPKQILIPAEPEAKDTIESLLSSRHSRKIGLAVPKRGEKKMLLDFAKENAIEQLRRHTLLGGSSATRLTLTLQYLSELTAANRPLNRIEAYDVSVFGTDDRTASLVVFTHGKPSRKDYRHFHVQADEGDTAALASVLGRRVARLGDDRFGGRPDLILVDGGIAQVNAAGTLLDDLGIAVAGIVKDERHRTRGLVTRGGVTIELSKLSSDDPDREDKLSLWRLLTAVQDEAHRFAGRLSKKQRTKRQTRWTLEAIPGVGPARRKALLEHFGTLKAISEATLEELEQTPKLDRKTARAVYAHYHSEEDE